MCEDGEAVEQEEEVEDYIDDDVKPERAMLANPPNGNDRLVQELTAQITVQEKLVTELANKETELSQQRKLFEEKLNNIQKEKNEHTIEHAKIKSKVDALVSDGGTSAESRALKKQYKRDMKILEQRIKQMESDARRRDRELAQNHKAQDQIQQLKANLARAKKERKELLLGQRTLALEAEKGESRRRKEIALLRKETAAKEAEARSLQSDMERQTSLVDKLKAENDKIRAELGHTAKSANADPPSRLLSRGSRLSSPSSKRLSSTAWCSERLTSW
jgi:chromosome segregation ATPase